MRSWDVSQWRPNNILFQNFGTSSALHHYTRKTFLKKIISQPSSPVEIKHQTENGFSVPDNSTKTNNSHLKSDVKYPCPSTMALEQGKHTSLFALISTQKTWVNPSLLASMLAVR
jgi:hypothetical protein